MANPKIKFKRSAVAGKRPTLSNLELGELALNTYDGKVFLRRDTSGVGIATTVSCVNPWIENYGSTAISYSGDVNVAGMLTATNINVTNFQATGVTTSFGGFILRNPSDASFDGSTFTFDSTSLTFDSSPISAGIYADGSASFSGIVTATGGFIGDLTGTATTATNAQGLTGTPNIAVGVLTASGLTYPSSDGSANQVLVTDGAGNLTFADQTASSGSSGPGVTTTNSTAQVGIDSFAKATYQSALYHVQTSTSTDYHLTTINIIHDSTNVYLNEYGTISTGEELATFTADVSGSNIRLLATPAQSSTTVFKMDRTLIGTGAAGITSVTTTSTSQTAISTFNKTTYNAAMFEVQVRRGTEIHTTTLHLVHNGTTVATNEFAVLTSGNSLATFDADISGSNVRLLATPTSATTTTFDTIRTFFS